MKNSVLVTTTGDYWHYNLVGTGVIMTYQIKRKKVIVTCEHTGQIIETIDLSKEGGYQTREEFAGSVKNIYMNMVEEGTTLNIDYYDDPTIIGVIGVDLKLLQN